MRPRNTKIERKNSQYFPSLFLFFFFLSFIIMTILFSAERIVDAHKFFLFATCVINRNFYEEIVFLKGLLIPLSNIIFLIDQNIKLFLYLSLSKKGAGMYEIR